MTYHFELVKSIILSVHLVLYELPVHTGRDMRSKNAGGCDSSYRDGKHP